MYFRALMGSFLPKFRPLAAAVVLLLVATACQAGTVTAYLGTYGNPGDPTIFINDGNGGAISSTSAFVGAFQWSNATYSNGGPSFGGSFSTFCIQLGVGVAPSPTVPYTYTTAPLSDGKSFITSSSTMTAIEKLWGGFHGQISTYSYNSNVNPAVNAAAFQLAIWGLEYGTTNFSSGNFQATGTTNGGADAVSLAEHLLLQATGQSNDSGFPDFTTPATNLVTLTGGTQTFHHNGRDTTVSRQDQLTATPEPSSMCLLAIGFGTFVAARYGRRKAKV